MVEAALAEKLRGLLQSAAPDVVAAYLYGSRARGNARRESDVDALLAGAPRPTLRSTARKLEADLESALRIPVEVVALNSAPADLVHRVLRDGALLLDRDRAARLRFEVQSRNEYFDLAPLRRLYRRTPGMTDPDLVAKKLALIETCVRQLRTMVPLEAIRQDVLEQRFVEHTLQIAI